MACGGRRLHCWGRSKQPVELATLQTRCGPLWGMLRLDAGVMLGPERAARLRPRACWYWRPAAGRSRSVSSRQTPLTDPSRQPQCLPPTTPHPPTHTRRPQP